MTIEYYLLMSFNQPLNHAHHSSYMIYLIYYLLLQYFFHYTSLFLFHYSPHLSVNYFVSQLCMSHYLMSNHHQISYYLLVMNPNYHTTSIRIITFGFPHLSYFLILFYFNSFANHHRYCSHILLLCHIKIHYLSSNMNTICFKIYLANLVSATVSLC